MPSFLFFLPLVVCAATGWVWSSFHLDEEEDEKRFVQLVYGERLRNPATIRKSFDFSRLSGGALQAAGRERLLKDITLAFERERIGLELGHFVVKGDHGDRVFACQHYERILFSFVAEGLAENGQRPEMTIEGACQMSADVNRMAPVWLPIKKMMARSPDSLRGHFFAKEKVFVDVKGAGLIWPRQWRLTGLKVFHQTKIDRVLEADAQRVRQNLKQPVILNW